MDEHHSWYNESVWHRDWSHQAYVGQWPIFYGSVILLRILKTIWWRNIVFGGIDQCDIKIDLVKYMWVSDHWFCLMYCYRLKLFLYFKKCIPRTLALVQFYIVANSNGTGQVRVHIYGNCRYHTTLASAFVIRKKHKQFFSWLDSIMTDIALFSNASTILVLLEINDNGYLQCC